MSVFPADGHEHAHETTLGSVFTPSNSDYFEFNGRRREEGDQSNAFLLGRESLPGIILTGLEIPEKNGDQADKSRPSSVTLESFADNAKRIFKSIDKDGDGYVSVKELAEAMENPSYKGLDAATLAALYAARSELGKFSDRRSKGISVDGLNKFEAMRQDSGKPDPDREAVHAAHYILGNPKLIKQFDQNGDGRLSRADIEIALKSDDLLSFDRKAFTYLRDNYRRITSTEGPPGYPRGINLEAFEQHMDTVKYQRNRQFANCDDARNQIASTLSRQPDGTREVRTDRLYSDSDNPKNSIHPDAIRQGTLSNCYFVAALASLAATNPGAIQQMIKDNGDGSYTVTFPGAPDEPITVKAPTEAEQMLYNGTSKYGTWASLLEKAYGAYCQKTIWRRGPFNIDGGNTPAEGSDGGALGAHGMRLLCGVDYFSNDFNFASRETVQKNLIEAFLGNSPRPVIADINGPGYSIDGFKRGHVYSVVGFDPSGPEGGTVTIRNPWGQGNGTGGTIQISLTKFMRNFSSAVYSRK